VTEPVPDVLIEKLALGELGEVEREEVKRRLGEDAEAKLSAIDRSNAEILEEFPPSDVAAEVQRRVERLDRVAAHEAERPRWTPWLGAAALAAAAILLWVIVRPPADTPPEGPSGTPVAGGVGDTGPTKIAKADPPLAGDDGSIRLKGSAKLTIHRQGEGRAERLSDGARVRAGDRLQVSYTAGDAALGVIVSIDGAGAATLHFPASERNEPTLLGRAQLPNGFELDDAPGFERFFFVTTQGERLSVSEVMRAAESLAASDDAREGELELADEVGQQSLLLTK